MKPGERLPPLRERPRADTPRRYAEASGDRSAVHLDAEQARAVGLPGVILHGMYTMALVARVANAAVNGDPRRLRSLAMEFRGLALPGEVLEVDGVVVAVADGTAHLELRARQGRRELVRQARAEVRELEVG